MSLTMIAEVASDEAPAEGATWRYLPLVLMCAFAVRAAFALTTNFITHADEIFQYLEQAHRLVFGYGFVPWEYQYGIRSWIIPGFIALILKSLAAVHLDRPDIYEPTVRLIFCAISVTLPASIYRIAQATLDESTARLALLATAFWPLLVFFSPTPMPDVLAAYSFFGALVWLFGRPTRPAMLAFGALAGLTLALRVQLGPMVAVAMLVAALRWRWRGWPAPVACLVVLVLAGALDAYTWGRWFSSFVSNIELNLFAHISDIFGISPGYYYLLTLAVYSAGLAYLGAFGLALSWRKSWPLAVMGLLQLAAFSAVGHKELRFSLPLIPIYLIGLAVFFARNKQRLRRHKTSLARQFPLTLCVIAVAAVMAFVGGLAIEIGHHDILHVYHLITRRLDVRQAYLMLSRRTDVKGVIDDSGGTWHDIGGYYDLHRPAPIYLPDLPATGIALVRQAPQLYASHWITPANAPAPEGYELLARIGRIALWRRIKDPPHTLTPPGYSVDTPIPFDEKAIPPAVTARW
jgi:hypothetical protein